jgi:hypothetical protein
MFKNPNSFLFFIIFLLVLALGAFVYLNEPAQASDRLIPWYEPEIALGTSFTYQGYLEDMDGPASGVYDFQFRLYDADTGTGQIGPQVDKGDINLSDGYFTVSLDFYATAFAGQKRWLEIDVKPDAESTFTTLAPRQEITGAPYALFALKALDADMLDGQHGSSYTYTASTGLILSSNAFSVDTSYVQRRVNQECIAGSSIRRINDNGTVVCETDDDSNNVYTAGTGISLTGSPPLQAINVVTSTIQSRVTGTCPSNQKITAIAANGTVTCANDVDTAYTAGTGINFSGAPPQAINVVTTTIQARVNGTCTTGQKIIGIAANGAVTCANDLDTTYAAGYGLTLASNTFSVTTTTIQKRITGSCRVGSTISKVNSDGTVACWDDAPLNRPVPPGTNIAAGFGGPQIDNVIQVTIGADGLPLILFSDASDNHYKVIHCADLQCATSTITTIDGYTAGSDYASFTIAPDGLATIAYYESVNTNLMWIARCSDVACSSVSTSQLPGLFAGTENDITIAADGYALIAAWEPKLQQLWTVHCSDATCSAAASAQVDPPPAGGALITNPDPTITLGADGLGLIAYWYSPTNDLRIAHCSDVPCSAATFWTNATPQPDGLQPSITTGADALGLVAYVEYDYYEPAQFNLMTAHCSNENCTTGTTAKIHSLSSLVPPPPQAYPSVTIGAFGLGAISFYDFLNGNSTIAIANCNNLACSSATISDWFFGLSPSAITISPSGNPIVASDNIVGFLTSLSCSDWFCTPYYRRR